MNAEIGMGKSEWGMRKAESETGVSLKLIHGHFSDLKFINIITREGGRIEIRFVFKFD
jgi:hypothetical protein